MSAAEQPETGAIMLDDHEENDQSINQSTENDQSLDQSIENDQSVNESNNPSIADDQSTNQSNNPSIEDDQSINHLDDQSDNLSISHSLDPTIDDQIETTLLDNQMSDVSINQTFNQSDESIDQSINQSAFAQTAEFTAMMEPQPISQSISQSNSSDEPDSDSTSINQPVNQSINQKFGQYAVDLSETMPASYQSVSQSPNQSVSQSSRQHSRQVDLAATIEQTIDQLLESPQNQSINQSINESIDIPDLAPLPSFASEEVRKLDQSIQSKRAKLVTTIQSINQLEQRINVMSAHLIHVQREYSHTTNLSNEQSKSINQSIHLSQVNDRSIGKLRQQSRDLKLELEKEHRLIDSLINQRVSLTDDVAQFQAKLNMNNEELLQWSLAAKQKDEDRRLIDSYASADSKLLSDRQSTYQKLLSINQSKRNELNALVTTSNELLICSQSLQSEYTKSHLKKMKLIDDWDQSVKTMYAKDAQLISISDSIIDVRVQTDAQKAKNAELNQFLTIEQAQNQKLTQSINQCERENVKNRSAFQSIKQSIISLEDTVLNKRAVLEKCESDLRASKQAHQTKQQKLNQSINQRDSSLKLLLTRSSELEQEEKSLKSVENQHSHLSEKLRVAQDDENKWFKSINQSKTLLFTRSETLSRERVEESRLIASINQSIATCRMLQSQIRQLDQRSLKQQETLYQIEYLIQGLERKKGGENGVKSVEEKEILQTQYQEIQQKLQAQDREMSVIQSAFSRVQHEQRGGRKTQEKLKKARASLSNATSELSVRIGAMEREFRSCTSEFRSLQVVHDRQQLELNAVSTRLYNAQGQLQKSQMTEIELQYAMKQRVDVIEQHKETRDLELKQAASLRAMHASECTERKRTLKLLEMKYRAMRAKFIGSQGLDDEKDGETRESQGYYIVQAGLKREELSIEREKAHAELTGLEQQIEGVTRVILEMQSMNQSINQSHPTSDLTVVLHEAQSRSAALDTQFSSARSRHCSIERELDHSKQVLSQLLNEVAQSSLSVRTCEKRATDLDKAQSNQISALKRARITANKRAIQTQEALFSTFTQILASTRRQEEKQSMENSSQKCENEAEMATKEEMDLIATQLRVAETRRRNAVWKDLLTQYAADHPDVAGTLADLCSNAGVKLEWEDTRPSSSVSSIVDHDSRMNTARSNISTASQQSNKSINQSNNQFNVSFPPINPNSRPGSNTGSGRSTGRR